MGRRIKQSYIENKSVLLFMRWKMTRRCLVVVICLFLIALAAKKATCTTITDFRNDFVWVRSKASENCSSVKSNAMLCKANKLFDEKRYQKAISLYTDTLIKEPSNSKIYEGRGMAYAFSGNYHKANKDFSKAIELDRNSCDAYAGRAIILSKLGFFTHALHEINRALKISPMDPSLYLNRSLIYYSLSDFKNSIADLNKSIEFDNSQTLAYVRRSHLRLKEGDTDGAINDIEIAIRLNPFDANLYYILSAYSYQNNDREKEIWALNKIIELKPDNDSFYYLRGLSWIDRSKYDLALKDFNAAISLNDSNAKYFYNRGRVNMYKGLYCEAIDDLRISKMIDKDHIDSAKLLIQAYITIGEYSFAVKELNILIGKRPNDFEIINVLAWILSTCPDDKIRNGKLALKLLDNIQNNKDNNLENLDTRAAAYAEIGNYNKAIILQESVIKELKDRGIKEKIEEYSTRLDFYRRNKPWRHKAVAAEKCTP